MKYKEKLERSTAKIGARFVDYLPETGSWVFEVEHFSKYRLVEDDDSEEEGDEKGGTLSKVKVKQTKELSSKGGQSAAPVGVPQKRTPLPQPKSDSEVDDESAPPMDEDQNWEKEEGAVLNTKPQSMVSPPSYQMAQARGLSSHRIQVMKASFFYDSTDGEEDKVSPLLGSANARSEQVLHKGSLPFGRLLSQSLKPHGMSLGGLPPSGTESRGKEADLRQQDSVSVKPSGLTELEPMDGSSSPHEVSVELADTTLPAPKVPYVPNIRQNFIMPPSVNSLDGPKSEYVRMDALQLFSRSFRVGWGPDWTIYHSGLPCSKSRDEKFSIYSATSSVPDPDIPRGSLPFRVLLEKVDSRPIQMSQRSNVAALLGYEPLLKIQLKYSSPNDRKSGDQLHLYTPARGTDSLHEYASLPRDLWPMDKQNSTHFWQVWQLCKALWGVLPTDEGVYWTEVLCVVCVCLQYCMQCVHMNTPATHIWTGTHAHTHARTHTH